jgi:hypothetical protein
MDNGMQHMTMEVVLGIGIMELRNGMSKYVVSDTAQMKDSHIET